MYQPNGSSASATWLFDHVFGEDTGFLVTFTGRQARLERDARQNELARVEQRTFPYPASSDAASRYLLAQGDKGRDAYFGVHLFRAGGNRRASNASDSVSCLWLDEDEGSFPEIGPEPTAVVRSSESRRHLYWRLSRSIPAADAVELNRRIALWSAGDSGKAGLASVLRVPGTFNYKRFPSVDHVVGEVTGVAAWDPGVIGQAIPPLPPSSQESKRSGFDQPYDGPKVELLDYLDDVNAEILGEAPDGAGRKFAIVCPWIEEHSGGDRTGTFVGQFDDGATWFHCHHEHCQGRSWRDYKRKVGRMSVREFQVHRGPAHGLRVVVRRG